MRSKISDIYNTAIINVHINKIHINRIKYEVNILAEQVRWGNSWEGRVEEMLFVKDQKEERGQVETQDGIIKHLI